MKSKTPSVLDAIKPGKTYPQYVEVIEPDGHIIEFKMNSFYVGMYCAIHVDRDSMPAMQTGDHNNKTFTTRLKKDLQKAIARGAKVTIGSIQNCKLSP